MIIYKHLFNKICLPENTESVTFKLWIHTTWNNMTYIKEKI